MVEKEIHELNEGGTVNPTDKIALDQYDASENPSGETVFKKVEELITINSDTSVVTGSTQIKNVIGLTQAEYDLITPDANTLYIINE